MLISNTITTHIRWWRWWWWWGVISSCLQSEEHTHTHTFADIRITWVCSYRRSWFIVIYEGLPRMHHCVIWRSHMSVHMFSWEGHTHRRIKSLIFRQFQLQNDSVVCVSLNLSCDDNIINDVCCVFYLDRIVQWRQRLEFLHVSSQHQEICSLPLKSSFLLTCESLMVQMCFIRISLG